MWKELLIILLVIGMSFVFTITDKKINELSNEKLADYKKKAGENASAADKAGDTKTGNKRFSGIMKATRKQFDNDAKQKTEELSPKQKAMDKNKNGKIDGFDLSHPAHPLINHKAIEAEMLTFQTLKKIKQKF